MNKVFSIGLAFLAFSVSGVARAEGVDPGPSFDCRAASRPVEKLICDNSELSALDLKMALAYKARIKRSIDPESLRHAQIEWIKNIRNQCSDSSCLKNAYLARISLLLADNPQPEALAPNSGQDSQGEANRTSLMASNQDNSQAHSQAVPTETDGGSSVLTDDATPTPGDVPPPGETDSPSVNQAPAENLPHDVAIAPQNEQKGSVAPSDKASESVGEFHHREIKILFLIGIISLLLIAAFLIRRGILAARRNAKLKDLDALYDSAAVGQLASPQMVIDEHKNAFKIKDAQQVVVEQVNLVFSRVHVDAELTWSCLFGVVDSAAYSQALSSYTLAMNQYELARQEHFRQVQLAKEQYRQIYHAQYAQWKANGSKGSPPFDNFTEPPFSAAKPNKPSESSFVAYHQEDGAFGLDFESKGHYPRFNFSESTGLSQRDRNEIRAVYAAVLQKIGAKSDSNDQFKGFGEQKALTMLDDEQLFQEVLPEAEPIFDSAMRQHLPSGSYIKEEGYEILSKQISASDIILPVYLASSVAGKKKRVTVHDHIKPSILLVKKST